MAHYNNACVYLDGHDEIRHVADKEIAHERSLRQHRSELAVDDLALALHY